MTATLDSPKLFSFASIKESAIPPHAVDDPKPKLRKAVRVWLSDGSRFFAMWTAPNGGVPKVSLPPSNGSLKNGKRKQKASQKFQESETQLDPLRRISVPDPQ